MTRLSNRQYPMLRIFAEAGANYFMTIEQAQTLDQRPFRSMLWQEWIAFKPTRGFHITKTGKEAWNEFLNTEILRGEGRRGMPLTSYFDPSVYGLQLVTGKRAAA